MGRVILLLLLFCASRGVKGQVHLEPRNASVLVGTDARFNCSHNDPNWIVMTWQLNNQLVLTITKDNGVVGNPGRFNATDFSTANSYKWELVIGQVRRNDSGQVTCSTQIGGTVVGNLHVQERGTVAILGGNRTLTEGQQSLFHCQASGWFPEPQLSWAVNGTVLDRGCCNSSSEMQGSLVNSRSTLNLTAVSSVPVECMAYIPALDSPLNSKVYLTVEKAVTTPPTRDQTVLIAVTVAFSAAALLALIIIGIVFCCKRRRQTKSSYEQEARAQTQRIPTVAAGLGRDNRAYVTDRRIDTHGKIDNRGFSQGNHRNTLEMQDEVNSNQATNGYTYTPDTLGGTDDRKHRHATIV